jgi:integrase/recombinase XerD
MAEEIRDTRESDKDYARALQRLEECRDITSADKERMQQFLKDCAIGKYSRKKVKIKRRLRYIVDLITLSEYLRKPWLSVTDEDSTRWYLELDKGNIKKKRGKREAYGSGGKNSFVETFHKFGKWLYRDNPEKYQKIFGWMKKFEENMEIPALARKEIEQIADGCNTRDKAIIMFLFDSGARASEFLNIRISDLKKGDENYYKVRIRISKTKPRTIILPIASNSLEAWLNVHPERNDLNAFLFPITYDGLRIMLGRKGTIIKKRVYPHLLRHSSATFYANRYKNPYKLCYRYGWAMNSKEVQRYIDREGIEEEEIKDIMEKESVDTLRKENRKISEELALLKDEHNKLFYVIKKLEILASHRLS